MGLRVFNTLTNKKQEFSPIHKDHVGMYVCGVTVYDMCHIGHARSLVLFDVIYRYLQSKGYKVTYVRNFTDVDDKIINRANERDQDWKSLAEQFIEEFYTDMDALGLQRPTVEPKATEHIQEIIDMVQKLIDRGYAYEVNGDVMFSIEKFKGYGKLSGKRIEDLVSGARVEIDDKKQNPLDFTLWKAAKPGEPSWDSPWGPGRPGWHIECSAMSMKYLGEVFDIHGGGADLAFPHHENEIAQSQAATGESFARYWIHNGFVKIRAEKMSKSLGNIINIRDVLRHFHPEALRVFLLSKHYRSPLDYNDSLIREASVSLERLYNAMMLLNKMIELRGKSKTIPGALSDISTRFDEAMDDDFNTPRGMALLFEAARAINSLWPGKQPPLISIPEPELLKKTRKEILQVAKDVLGLITEDPKEFLDRLRKTRAKALGITSEEIEEKIEQRSNARKNKDFALADKIRGELAEKGILLEDSPEGTVWRVREGQSE